MNLMELFVKIGADTSDFDDEVSGIGDKVKRGIGGALSTAAKAGAAGLAAASTAVVAFGKSAVNSGMQFDSAMSQVAATMGKPVSEIQNLRDFAQEMGSKTAFSATQAAEALNYMALAGYKDTEAMQMLPNVLNLAAAGNMDLATASDMVTDAQSALGLTFEETETMVDQMAKTSSTTNTSVSQLGDAILTIGATARGVKGGTAELSQVLGLLADNGIKGAEGGTHLRNIILSLQTPTKDGTEALEKLGMSYADMYDEAGNMRSLPEIFQQLENAMAGMTQESKDAIISGVFNKTDLAAVNALVGTNKDRWDEVAGAIADADGAAEAMANTQLDNLNGDVTLFKSALEGAQIAMSDKMTPTLRNFVKLGTKGLSDMTDAFKKGGLNAAMESFGTFLSTALTQVVDTIPTIVDAAATLLTAFVQGISQNIGKVTTAAVSIIRGIVQVIITNLPMVVSASAEMVASLIQGLAQELPNMIPVFIDAIRGIGDALPEGIKQYILPTFGSITAFLDDVFKGDWAAAWEEIKNIFHNAFTGVKDFIVDAFGTAKDAVMTVDWIGLGENIVSTVISAFTEFATMMFDLFTTAAEATMQVDWGAVGTQIFTFIMDAFGQLVEYWTNLFTMAKDAITQIDWGAVGTQIADFFISSFETIKEGIANIDWIGLGTAILDFIITAFGAATETFGTIFTNVWDYISTQIDWLGLGNTIWDTIISAFNFVGEWALEKFGYLADVIKTVKWLDVGNKIWDTIISAFNNVAGWAKEKFEFLGDKIREVDWKKVGSDVWEAIKKGFSMIVDWGHKVGDRITTGINSINWHDLGESVWNKIKEFAGILTSTDNPIVNFGSSVGDKIREGIANIKWVDLGKDLWGKIKEGVLAINTEGFATINFGEWLGAKIREKLFGDSNLNIWSYAGQQIWAKIKEGWGFVSANTGAVWEWAKNLGGNIRDTIFNIQWAQLGTDVWNAIKSGFTQVTEWFTGLFDFSNIHIKTPHFDIKWQEIGFGISIPYDFGITWYKKAYSNPYLFKSPGILGGYGFGDLGGYQGGEMVYSHDNLMRDIRDAVNGNGSNVTINVYQQPGEDGEALAERISQIMNDDYSRQGRVVYA